MTRVVIVGAGDAGRRIWEALVQCGAVEIVAFADDDPRRQGRTFLGERIHPLEWLDGGNWDLIATTDGDRAAFAAPGDTTGLSPGQMIVFPLLADADALARIASSWFPDPLRPLLAQRAIPSGLRIGVFGTGAAGTKIWETVSELAFADIVWFADNDPKRQGQRFLWADVIAPSEIPSRAADAVVVGSMSRDPIRRQLLTLGIPADRILVPDVTRSADEVREQLVAALVPLVPETLAR